MRPCYVWMIPLRRHDISDLDCMDEWTCLGNMNIPIPLICLFLWIFPVFLAVDV